MNEEKMQELIKYLTSIGFQSTSLEQSIRENIDDKGLEQFYAKHEMFWGNEKIQFDLYLTEDQQFQSYRLASYKATYSDDDGNISKQTFSPTARGICNANLAYYIVSGRFNDLMEKISLLSLGEFPGVDVYPNIDKLLSKNLNEFTLKCSRNEAEGYVEYKIPVSKIDSWYYIETYTATLTPYPSIEHGTFNGIDSQELEAKMRRLDWHNDRELFSVKEDSEPELLAPALDIYNEMVKLSGDTKGAIIADQLQLKYWSSSSFFETFIEQRAWDFANALPKREQNFPIEIEAKAAFNRLCGRATLQNRVYPFPHEKPAWVRFNFTMVGSEGGYLNEVTPDFSQAQLEDILSSFPIPSDIHPKIIRELNRGDITPLVLPNDKKIFIEANPEQKTVNIYSEDMRPIQVNLHFDPNWKSVENKELNSEELKWKPRKNIIRSDHLLNKKNPFRRRR